jgi:hypothetical protein
MFFVTFPFGDKGKIIRALAKTTFFNAGKTNILRVKLFRAFIVHRDEGQISDHWFAPVSLNNIG